MSHADSRAELSRRASALRAPPPLTAGIELDQETAGLVTNAAEAVGRNGYAIIPGFLDAERLDATRAAMAPVFEMTTSRDASISGRYTGIQTVHVHNLFAKTRAVDPIAIDPRLLKLIEGVLGPLFQMSGAAAMCPDPGVDPQGLHQDDGHYPLPRPRPPFIANTLIALDDFTEASG